MCTNKNVKSIYTIAADEVDINLLQFRSYVQNKKQLYSLCNYSSPCYYDVEVMAARRNVIEEVEDDTSTNDEMYKNYKCHICNIDVPIVFFKEHNNSSIHKTYAAIANKAMERIKLQMNVELQAAPTKTPLLHFCDICVLVIKKTDRIEHEKCRIHQISMTHNRILQDLAQIYINNDFKVESNPLNDQNIALKTSDNANAKLQEDDVKTNIEIYADSVESDSQVLDSKKNNTVLKKNIFFNLLESNGNLLDEKKQPDHKVCSDPVKISGIDKDNVIMRKNVRIKCNKKDHKKVTKADNKLKKTCENLNNVAVNSKIQNEIDWIDINQYIDEINKINDGNLIVVTKEHQIHITTVSGDIFEVSLAQFCGYTKIGSKWACNICQSFIVHDATVKHEYLEQHVDGILMPLQDKNCLRAINDVYLHCVICNVSLLTTSELSHITHESHITRVKEAFIYNEKFSKVGHKDKLGYELCQPPDQGIAQTLLINVENVKGKFSTEASTKSAQNIDHNKTTEDQNIAMDKNVEDDAYKKFIPSNKEIRMLLNKNITETADGNTTKCDLKAAEEHLSSQKHTEKLNPKFLQNNCISKNTNGYFCNVCCQNVPSGGELEHISDQNHKDKMSQADRYGSTSSYCGICCVDVGVINMSAHTKGKKHQQNLKIGNGNLDNDTDKVQMELTDDPNLLQNNCISKNTNGYFCNVCCQNVPSGGELEHISEQNHKDKMSQTDRYGSTSSYCGICCVDVGVINMSAHTKGKKHQQNLKIGNGNLDNDTDKVQMELTDDPNLLQNNCISKNTNGYFCDVCCQNVPSGGELEHISEQNHKDKMSRTDRYGSTSSYCGICGVDVGVINMSAHTKGKKHQQNLKIVNGNLDNDTDKVQMESTDDPNLLQNNCISKNTNGYFCNVCCQNVPSGGELEHISEQNHKDKMSRTDRYGSTSSYCGICCVDVGVINMSAHTKGKKHQQNLKIGNGNLDNDTDKVQMELTDDPNLLQNNCISKNTNGYFCDVCCQNVPSGGELEHISEQNHKDKMSQTDRYGSTSSYCGICCVDVGVINMSAHTKGKKHQQNLKIVNGNLDNDTDKVQIESTDDPKFLQNNCIFKNTNGYFCNVCCQNVPSGGELEHISEQNHKDKMSRTDRYGSTSSYCGICCVDVGVINMSAHTKGKKHQQNLKIVNGNLDNDTDKVQIESTDDPKFLQNNCIFKNTNGYFCNVCCQNVPSGGELEHISEQNHKDKMSRTDRYGSTCSYCGICCVDVGVINMSAHTKGKKHQQNLKIVNGNLDNDTDKVQIESTDDPKFLQNNCIFINTNGYFCNVCCQNVPSSGELEHISEQNHKDKMSQADRYGSTSSYCGICCVDVGVINMSAHTKGKKHQQNLKIVNGNLDNDTDKVQIESTDDPKFLQNNCIFKNTNGYFCNVCCQNVPSGGELEHISEQNHKDKMSRTDRYGSTSSYCGICCVDVGVINMSAHTKGKKHQQNLKIVNGNLDNDTDKVQIESTDDPKFLQNNCIFKNTNGYFCNVCCQNVPSGGELEHISEQNHKDKMSRTDRYGSTCSYCGICCVDVGVINMSAHTKGKKHQQNLKIVNGNLDNDTDKVQMESTDDPKVLHCRICKVKVPKTNEREHMLGVNHKNNLVVKLHSNKMCKATTGYNCEECKIDTDIGHMFEDCHLSKIYNLSEDSLTSSSTKTSQSVSVKSDVCHHSGNFFIQGISKSFKDVVKKPSIGIKNNRKQMKATADLKNMLCTVCNAEVQNTTEGIDYHLNSVEHKLNYMKVIDKRLEKMPNGYSCKYCQNSISDFTKMKHIFSRGHKKNVANLVKESKATK